MNLQGGGGGCAARLFFFFFSLFSRSRGGLATDTTFNVRHAGQRTPRCVQIFAAIYYGRYTNIII